MYYQPKLANGKLVKNPWNVRAFRALNHIAWPLEDDANKFVQLWDRCYWILGFLIFVVHNDAELRYLIYNYNNIDELLTGVPTYVVLIEVKLRAFQMGLVKEEFKQKVLKKFYANIFIEDEAINQELNAEIQRKFRPTCFVAVLYFLSLFLFILKMISNFAYSIREPMYKMTFAYDTSANIIFYTIILCNFWVGLLVISFIFGELSLVGQIVLHLNGRFKMLGQDLERYSKALLAQEIDPAFIAFEFQLKLAEIIKRNLELYKFAAHAQQTLSFRFFIWFAFSAILLCACSFKVYTNPSEGIGFLFWSISKLLELGSIGELGSTIIETTNGVSSMYYHSNWERIIERSTNTKENLRLMKMVLLAMQTSHKPFSFTGLNFFTVSLMVVMSIIHAAFSYFTFLEAMR